MLSISLLHAVHMVSFPTLQPAVLPVCCIRSVLDRTFCCVLSYRRFENKLLLPSCSESTFQTERTPTPAHMFHTGPCGRGISDRCCSHTNLVLTWLLHRGSSSLLFQNTSPPTDNRTILCNMCQSLQILSPHSNEPFTPRGE